MKLFKRGRAADRIFTEILFKVTENSNLKTGKLYIQHGNTSCFLHSVAVAYYSFAAARFLKPVSFREKELIRGALLHDWHIKDKSRRFHGFYHPSRALKNAESIFNLSSVEKDIIKKHMFPLTLYPPRYRESILVCIIDKACCIYECFKTSPYRKFTARLELQPYVN